MGMISIHYMFRSVARAGARTHTACIIAVVLIMESMSINRPTTNAINRHDSNFSHNGSQITIGTPHVFEKETSSINYT